MDLKDNPEVPEKISEHKSVQDQELAVKYDSSEDKVRRMLIREKKTVKAAKKLVLARAEKLVSFVEKSFHQKAQESAMKRIPTPVT